MPIIHSRRDVLAGLSLAGAALLARNSPSLADEGPPETTTIRLRRDPSICVAPWYIAEIAGICAATGDDEERLARGGAVFEDLHSHFRRRRR